MTNCVTAKVPVPLMEHVTVASTDTGESSVRNMNVQEKVNPVQVMVLVIHPLMSVLVTQAGVVSAAIL